MTAVALRLSATRRGAVVTRDRLNASRAEHTRYELVCRLVRPERKGVE